MKAVPTVAIINSISDVIEAMADLLREENYHVVTALIDHIRKGKLDLLEFLSIHDPFVVIYDIPPPFEENWRFLKLIRSSKFVSEKQFNLSTTNKVALEQLVGNTPTIELVGRPFDFETILAAVKKTQKALEDCGKLNVISGGRPAAPEK